MRIGRYELFGAFATGGMASVHFGKLFATAGFQRIVAIKVPHAQFIRDHEIRSMFLDEARIVARIRSPHVVATLDILEDGETLYQVMEYASGPSLSSVLKATRAREEPVPIPLALAIVTDALEGLHTAHEVKDDQGAPLNVVHRDVSPQNILVTEDGVAKVIDFGIASAAGKLHRTQPGIVKGKVSYMSPEQIDGRKVDRRADVYAVGVVLYEILTGEKPFAGDDFAGTALLQMLKPPADPRALRSDVSPELASIVLRALEKKPQDRFDTARHMADALLALPSGRAAPRELAEWVADTNRGFFVERGAVISSLPSLEGVLDRVTEPDGPRWSQVPTHVEVVARSAKPGETDRSVEPPTVSRKSFRVAVVGMTLALAAAGVFATLGRASRPKSDGQILKSAPSVAPAVSVSPVESPVAAAPREPALPSSAPPAATAPPATPRAHNATPTDAGSKREAATSPSTPLPDPPCCSGDLRIRFTHCLDNCPAGT